MALVPSPVVLNGHIAVIIDPQFTDDDVVSGRCHLAPRVVVPATKMHRPAATDRQKGVKKDARILLELQMGDSMRDHGQIFATEF